MEEKTEPELLDERQYLALRLYREAEEAQRESRHWKAAILFSLSDHVTWDRIHPNSVYQVCWSLACVQEWELCSKALNVLFLHYPAHEAGVYLNESIQVLLSSDLENAVDMHSWKFSTPKALRILVQQAASL